MKPDPAPSKLHARRNTSRRRSDAFRHEPLDVDCLSASTQRLNEVLRARIIGQDDAIEVVTHAFTRVLANLRDPHRPALSMLLLGPTGVGKTETARALAAALFGVDNGLTRVACEDYAHGHEVAKLIGSPPGYVGYGAEPLLSQRKLDRAHVEAVEAKRGLVGRSKRFDSGRCLSVLLFDEVEKANPVLWNSLLGILDEGVLTLGDGSETDLTQSIVVLTTNVGSREMSELFSRKSIGFLGSAEPSAPEAEELDQAVLLAASEMFPIEFLNRLDEKLVYSSLGPDALERILDKFLGELHERVVHQAGYPLLIKLTPAAKRLIVARGTDPRLGARPLRHALDVELIAPLSRLIAARAVDRGDVVHVGREGGRLVFSRERGRGAAVTP